LLLLLAIARTLPARAGNSRRGADAGVFLVLLPVLLLLLTRCGVSCGGVCCCCSVVVMERDREVDLRSGCTRPALWLSSSFLSVLLGVFLLALLSPALLFLARLGEGDGVDSTSSRRERRGVSDEAAVSLLRVFLGSLLLLLLLPPPIKAVRARLGRRLSLLGMMIAVSLLTEPDE